MKMVYKSVPIKEFIDDVLTAIACDNVRELGYYFFTDDVFLPIDEIHIFTGRIEVKCIKFNITQEIFSIENEEIFKKVLTE